jgi:hypothetical protein
MGFAAEVIVYLNYPKPEFHLPHGQGCRRHSFFMPGADVVQIEYLSMEIMDISEPT